METTGAAICAIRVVRTNFVPHGSNAPDCRQFTCFQSLVIGGTRLDGELQPEPGQGGTRFGKLDDFDARDIGVSEHFVDRSL